MESDPRLQLLNNPPLRPALATIGAGAALVPSGPSDLATRAQCQHGLILS